MVFKLDATYKGRTYHFESDSEALLGKKIGDKVEIIETRPISKDKRHKVV